MNSKITTTTELTLTDLRALVKAAAKYEGYTHPLINGLPKASLERYATKIYKLTNIKKTTEKRDDLLGKQTWITISFNHPSTDKEVCILKLNEYGRTSGWSDLGYNE